MPTVIDSLVVLLGLDASNYKKGRETAERETSETARKAKLSADSITKSLTDVGKSVAALFLGFESASGFAKFLGSLNAGEAQLGRTAKSIGMSAHELNKWGGAVQLAGGQATDAQAAFRQLTEDFTKMATTGERSPLLTFMMNRGVNIRDANGQLRNQGQLFEELADKTAQYGAVYQATMFRQAGLNEGEINYLIESKALRQEQIALAERNNNVSDKSVEDAQKLQEHWRSVGQMITAAGQALLSSVTPTLDTILKQFGSMNDSTEEFTTGLKLIGSVAVGLRRILFGIGDAFGGAAAAANAILHGNFREAKNILDNQSANSKAADQATDAQIAAIWNSSPAAAAAAIATGTPAGGGYIGPKVGSAAYRHNNPGNIEDARTGKIRDYATLLEGKAALDQDLHAKMSRGLTTINKLIDAYEGHDPKNNIPQYVDYVSKQLGKGGNDQIGKADIPFLIQAMTDFEGGNRNSLARLQSGATPSIGGRAGGAAAGGGNNVTVTVGTIQVNAPNADPTAVAQQIPAAIQRKLSVAQADTGQN